MQYFLNTQTNRINSYKNIIITKEKIVIIVMIITTSKIKIYNIGTYRFKKIYKYRFNINFKKM